MSTLSALVLWFGSFFGGPVLPAPDCAAAQWVDNETCVVHRSATADEGAEADGAPGQGRGSRGSTWGFTISNGF